MKERERESPLRVEVLKRCFYRDNLPIFQKVNEIIKLQTSHLPPSKTSNPDDRSSIEPPRGLNRQPKHNDEISSPETFSQHTFTIETSIQETASQEASNQQSTSQETVSQEILISAYGEHKTIIDFITSSITAMPPTNLTEALEISLKRHRAINADLSNIPEALKKIDKAIREPTVKTSIKVAQVLRPVMKLIQKIMTDFEVYDDMCADIRGLGPQHDEEGTEKPDTGKDNDGLDDGVRDEMKVDEAAHHDSVQANGGAEEDDSGKRDSALPSSETTTAIATSSAATTNAQAEAEAETIDPTLTSLPTKHSPTTSAEGIQTLLSLNETYAFLQKGLLRKLKTFDKAMTETLTKPAAGVRAELVRGRWDEVVGEWRAGFLRFWVGVGGDLGRLR